MVMSNSYKRKIEKLKYTRMEFKGAKRQQKDLHLLWSCRIDARSSIVDISLTSISLGATMRLKSLLTDIVTCEAC